MAAVVITGGDGGDGGGKLFGIASIVQFYKSCAGVAGDSCADI